MSSVSPEIPLLRSANLITSHLSLLPSLSDLLLLSVILCPAISGHQSPVQDSPTSKPWWKKGGRRRASLTQSLSVLPSSLLYPFHPCHVHFTSGILFGPSFVLTLHHIVYCSSLLPADWCPFSARYITLAAFHLCLRRPSCLLSLSLSFCGLMYQCFIVSLSPPTQDTSLLIGRPAQ